MSEDNKPGTSGADADKLNTSEIAAATEGDATTKSNENIDQPTAAMAPVTEPIATSPLGGGKAVSPAEQAVQDSAKEAKDASADDADDSDDEKKSVLSSFKAAAAKASEKAAEQTRKLRNSKPESTETKTATGASPGVAPGATPTAAAITGAAVTGTPSGIGKQRKVRLTLSRIDIVSTLKLSFLLSVAIGIMTVIATMITWTALDNLAVFTQINDLIVQITEDPDWFPVLEYFAFSRVVSFSMLIAVINVVIITALATVIALLYNVIAALVGGVRVTMTDE